MSDEAREESLKISRPLVLTSGFQVFADQLYNRFIQLLAIAVGATVDQLRAREQSTYMIDLAPLKLRVTYLAASMTVGGVSNFLG
jgi:hypothetical protein